MKTINDKKWTTIYLIFSLTLVFILGCNEEDKGKSLGEEETMISLAVRAASRSINEDRLLWEDRVDELRMIVFSADNNEVVFNQKLYFPNGFAEKSKAVKLPVGTYNFYFIANETVYNGDFVNALMNIQVESDFENDSGFTSLPYNPSFTPDGASSEGRFVMSGIYKNIEVLPGGTERNPLPLAISGGVVELIRSLAKVEVIFRKRLAGSDVPENTITSVLLENVASNISVPPTDDYYQGDQQSSLTASLNGLDYNNDSIGAVTFYIPELLLAEGATNFTVLEINNNHYPIETDDDKEGIIAQRREVPILSNNSVIRNYHYKVNAYIDAQGGIQIQLYVQPWNKATYTYLFQGDQQIIIPPVLPTDSSIIITTECGKVEILSHNEQLSQGLQGAYNDIVNYYDPELQGPTIYRGDPPYYCEKKYGEGWRLIDSCELLSFLAICDAAYSVWLSNTWLAADHDVPYYPLRFRQAAQTLLESLTGFDLSGSVLMNENNWGDQLVDEKLDLIDRFFTPGDIMLREMDFPGGWPFEAPPGTNSSENWYYNEVTIQVKAFWYGSGYITLTDRDNWDKVLYGEFHRYDYGSTVSRCVRTVE